MIFNQLKQLGKGVMAMGKDLIKRRPAKLSKWGLYLSDTELSEVLQPGDHLTYAVDLESKQVVILPTEELTGNCVAPKKQKSGVKPLIHLRAKDIQEAFQGCTHLQVEIYRDRVVVSGYVPDTDAQASITGSPAVAQDAQMEGAGEAKISRRVLDITHLLNVKKQVEVVLSRKAFKKVVGSDALIEQLMFDFVSEEAPAQHRSQVRYIQQALGNIHIPLQAASLFSGAGIFDLGWIDAGFEVLFALELNPAAVKTYRHNLGDHIHEANITTFDKKLIPKVPVMFGGSPCQGFSNANRHSNFLDNPNNSLVREYISAVKANENCQVFVLENVPQLLTAGDGQFKQEIIDALPDFDITSGVLSAEEFGDPQARKRAVFIGGRKETIGKIELPAATHPGADQVTVEQAFHGLHDGISNQTAISASRAETVATIAEVPYGGNWSDLPDEMRDGQNHHSSYLRRPVWGKPSFTIVNPRKGMLLHPVLNRILSMRECARLFSVPDWFTFQGTLNAMQQQIANAVPVRMAAAVARTVRQAIEQFNIRSRFQAMPVGV